MGVPQLCWRKMDVMEPLLRRCCAGTLWRSNFIEDYLVLPFNNELLRRLRDSRQFFVRRPWSICSSTSRRRQRSSTTPPSNATSNVRDSIVCWVIKNVQTRVCVCRDANVLSMNSRKVNRVSILFNNFFLWFPRLHQRTMSKKFATRWITFKNSYYYYSGAVHGWL